MAGLKSRDKTLEWHWQSQESSRSMTQTTSLKESSAEDLVELPYHLHISERAGMDDGLYLCSVAPKDRLGLMLWTLQEKLISQVKIASFVQK